MDNDMQHFDPAPTFEVDLVINVLVKTIFSPSFVFLIPVFYIFQGAKPNDAAVVVTSTYLVFISLFWLIKWFSKLYRNQGSLFFESGPLDWGEQIVVVTGGASGVGELLANTLAIRNVTVVVLDIDPVVTENYNITYYKCDVSKWEEVEAVSRRINEEIGPPTILVNNAGVVQGKLLTDLKPEDVQQTFGVNTLAHFWTLKAFLPGMLRRGSGHIVSVASIMGMIGVAQMTDYNASKAAIVSLHESLRFELDRRYKCPKIRTTLVCPGHLQTRMFKTVRLSESLLARFFFPSVQPVTVVKLIITALHEQHSQRIMVPFYTHLVPYLPHLPSFLRDAAQWMANADHAMVNFIKITGRRNSETGTPSFPTTDMNVD